MQNKKFLLIIDSWGGQTDATMYDSIFKDEDGSGTCTLKIIPPKCTSLCQPCDVYFYRQIKMFIRRLQNAPEVVEAKREISSREDSIKIHSILMNQLSSPKCIPMLKYAWFASNLTPEQETFLNLNQLCFPVQRKSCKCNKIGFVKCTWCDEFFCFSCFYDDYHPNVCSILRDQK